MARTRGQQFSLAMNAESVFGTAPAAPWRRMFCLTFDLGSAQTLNPDAVISAGLGRAPATPYLNNEDVRGTAVVPVEPFGLGFWLVPLLGPTASATSNGDGTFTHVWNPPPASSTSLRSLSIEKQLAIAATNVRYMLSTGVKVDSAEFTWSQSGDQRPTASFGLIGRREVFSGTSAAGSLTAFSGYRPFMQRDGAVQVGGSSIGNLMAATLRISNGLEVVRTVNAGGLAEGIDEGSFSAMGEITVRHDQDFLTAAVAQSDVSFNMSYVASDLMRLEFSIDRAKLGRPSIGVRGPGGVEVTYPFMVVPRTDGAMMTVNLRTTVASF